ncbi:hypothetical protein TNIN_121141 [Trichonephila inaurata madagascariensis]|uniref:Uncharacterized protein n=1 Tax=Trichonephila inaurata madagascariensis TaxID=2747483 RepID=A0A8X7C4S0_9ARAC|nr:hypothetical protein TNIN_121141 [Trichonephila inaurata madagascariensis]
MHFCSLGQVLDTKDPDLSLKRVVLGVVFSRAASTGSLNELFLCRQTLLQGCREKKFLTSLTSEEVFNIQMQCEDRIRCVLEEFPFSSSSQIPFVLWRDFHSRRLYFSAKEVSWPSANNNFLKI